MASNQPKELPRVLIISSTLIGGDTATGQLKKTLFADWPKEDLRQVYAVRGGRNGRIFRRLGWKLPDHENLWGILVAECHRFRPEVIYYRPVDSPIRLHQFACRLIGSLDVPVVTHIMDDWPERLRCKSPEIYDEVDKSLRELLNRSVARLSICDTMSSAYRDRYGHRFVTIANCVNPLDWPDTCRNVVGGDPDEPFLIRYTGSLQEDMTLQSVIDVAQAVDALQERGNIKLEIYTMPWWRNAMEVCSSLRGVSLHKIVRRKRYYESLTHADALLLAYNFDDESIAYTRYSMANKLPEYMASGVPIIAYGPHEVASIAYAADSDVTYAITKRNLEILQPTIFELKENSRLRSYLGNAARRFVFAKHNCKDVRRRFMEVLRRAAGSHDFTTGRPMTPSSCFGPTRSDHQDYVNTDEAELAREAKERLSRQRKAGQSEGSRRLGQDERGMSEDMEKCSRGGFIMKARFLPALDAFIRAGGVTRAVVKVYARWPGIIAMLAIICVSLGQTKMVYGWIAGALGTGLILFLIGYAVARAHTKSEDVKREVMEKINRVIYRLEKEKGRNRERTHEPLNDQTGRPSNRVAKTVNLPGEAPSEKRDMDGVVPNCTETLSIALDENIGDLIVGVARLLRDLREDNKEYPAKVRTQIDQLSRDLHQRLIAEEIELKNDHPLDGDIFYPTDAIRLEDRVSGLRRVLKIYEYDWKAIYPPKLKELRKKYLGHKRCFIIGNGPSLNKTDLSKLSDDVSFGVNGIFLKFPETRFRPSFYVVEDHLVAEDRSKQINELKGPIKLFPINLAYCLNEGSDTIFFNHRPRKSYPRGFDFSTDASKLTYSGCSVTFTCVQLAFYFGFKEIYLIGVDFDYEVPDDVERKNDYGVEVLDMKADDPNHFHPDYFGKGYRWHDPQVDKMGEAFAEAKRVAEAHGTKIFNATIGGKLEIFKRVDYESLFKLRS